MPHTFFPSCLVNFSKRGGARSCRLRRVLISKSRTGSQIANGRYQRTKVHRRQHFRTTQNGPHPFCQVYVGYRPSPDFRVVQNRDDFETKSIRFRSYILYVLDLNPSSRLLNLFPLDERPFLRIEASMAM